MAVRSRQTHNSLLKMHLCLKSVWMCVLLHSACEILLYRFRFYLLPKHKNVFKMTYKCIYCYLTGYIIVFVLILKCARCHLNAFLLVDRQKRSFPLRPSHKVIRYTNTFLNSK